MGPFLNPCTVSRFRSGVDPKRFNEQLMTKLNLSLLSGSALEMFCQVLTDCRVADSTEVTWLVNGQSVAMSHLDERAMQGGRR